MKQLKTEVIDKNFGSIMILVPHQDDEILMAAGIMEQAVREGVDVNLVMVTNGDYGSSDYSIGRKRLKESIAGLEVLGLTRESLILLGYADTGMPQEDSFLTRLYESEDAEKVWESHCSDQTYGLEDQGEYHLQKRGRHAAYTRKNCYEDIMGVIRDYKPENIFTTSLEDTHGDHSGLFLFVQEALKELETEGYMPRLYSGIVHSKAGDERWPKRTEAVTCFTCPDYFDDLGKLKWEDRVIFEVPEDMREKDPGKNRKALALSEHRTALKPDAVNFLYSFVKSEEIFWKVNE